MTYTELVNTVLRRLRENEVSSVNDSSYAKLIGDFVNEAKREVEDSWNWNALRTTIQILTDEGTSRYELVGSGQRYRTLWVYNQTQKTGMNRPTSQWMTRQMLVDDTTGCPLFYDYNDFTSGGDTYVDLYQAPDGVYAINFNLVVPQPDFTIGTEVLEVPSMPVVLGAYAKALAERGEDQGRTAGEVFAAYDRALSDAIAIDVSNTTYEDNWYSA